jgi:hypothetical protein
MGPIFRIAWDCSEDLAYTDSSWAFRGLHIVIVFNSVAMHFVGI